MVARADGIGPKLAQRIVNELAQKTGALASTGLASGQMGQALPLRLRRIAAKMRQRRMRFPRWLIWGILARGFYSPAKSQEGLIVAIYPG